MLILTVSSPKIVHETFHHKRPLLGRSKAISPKKITSFCWPKGKRNAHLLLYTVPGESNASMHIDNNSMYCCGSRLDKRVCHLYIDAFVGGSQYSVSTLRTYTMFMMSKNKQVLLNSTVKRWDTGRCRCSDGVHAVRLRVHTNSVGMGHHLVL